MLSRGVWVSISHFLFLAQSASWCGSCSQKSHLPHAQHRGSLSLQEDIWRSHENPVFEILRFCISHFSFVQTSVEPLAVWSSFLFLSIQHNTFHQHLFPGALFTFACSSEEMQSLLASEALSALLAVLEQVSSSGSIPNYRTCVFSVFLLCYFIRLQLFPQDDMTSR